MIFSFFTFHEHQAAESSLRFYRNIQETGKQTPVTFQEELDRLKSQLGGSSDQQIEKTPLLLTDFSKFQSYKSYKLN